MIAIVDYNAGNLTSVKRALDYLGVACTVSPDPAVVLAADRVIFPGVGHASAAMSNLAQRGLDNALRTVFSRGTPLLGICLGAQIVLSRSEEGDSTCLGILEGTVPRFKLKDKSLKIPHMGWDSIAVKRQHALLKGIPEGAEFYFVHSYYPQPAAPGDVIATCEYETVFPAMIGSRNLAAAQFHPEKSGEAGLSILRNFSSWDGAAC